MLHIDENIVSTLRFIGNLNASVFCVYVCVNSL